ncbi:ATP-dependent DNA helicase [Thiorhodospira sibirica]|uniref:ATP-dependent DNA helicase n=1 Tax=Thiorhodospira sibirica TaxID=154347 RepID=UPI001FE47196|nr:ATP-dependent DNA helicase [Thiorhodospira sibirica]
MDSDEETGLDPVIYYAAALLGDDGPFSQHQQGFRARLSQQQMAHAVEEALVQRQTLMVEAGTGVGKTFAYLVAALVREDTVIISTGTRNLQDQLYNKDLPLVQRALGLDVPTALLKGRSNYICPYRLELARSQGQLANMLDEFQHLEHISQWLERTDTGDIAELGGIPEDSALWPQVTSTVENCLGQECPCYSDCFVLAARRRSHEAQIIVINHHVLLADIALKSDHLGELLPPVEAFIIDEAHQLPEAATHFFAQTVSARQLVELSRDILTEQGKDAADMRDLKQLARTLPNAVEQVRKQLGEPYQRTAWAQVMQKPGLVQAIAALEDTLATLIEHLAMAAERGKGLEQCARRAMLQKYYLNLFKQPEQGSVLWVETFARGFNLNLTPLEIAAPFSEYRAHSDAAWIFTSATLSVDGDFSHFSARLGLSDSHCLQLPSPFDYPRNTRLYCPPGMPQPNESGYTQAMLNATLAILEQNPGGSFLLFTSHRALREAAQWLQRHLQRPILVQGQAPRGELLTQFRQHGSAVLLGAQSFWEGVDVRGAALSCVIIDKLPFASPGDPVLEARLQYLREQGANPFVRYQLPQAVINLKQGVGRLIRDVSDRGLLVICDPRLHTKAYGRTFLQSLPAIPQCQDLQTALDFLKQGCSESH